LSSFLKEGDHGSGGGFMEKYTIVHKSLCPPDFSLYKGRQYFFVTPTHTFLATPEPPHP